MGSYDGVEICELVEFFLYELSAIIPKEGIGLYGDDSLAKLRNSNGHNTGRTKNLVLYF